MIQPQQQARQRDNHRKRFQVRVVTWEVQTSQQEDDSLQPPFQSLGVLRHAAGAACTIQQQPEATVTLPEHALSLAIWMQPHCNLKCDLL